MNQDVSLSPSQPPVQLLAVGSSSLMSSGPAQSNCCGLILAQALVTSSFICPSLDTIWRVLLGPGQFLRFPIPV